METKTNNNYTISKEMMNCFKQLLFSANGNVNLKGIINDLTFGQGDDLIACATALAFKGIKPEIDKTPRFEYGYKCYNVYDIVDYSMILDTYKVTKTCYNWDSDKKAFIAGEPTEELYQSVVLRSLSSVDEFDISRVRGIDK